MTIDLAETAMDPTVASCPPWCQFEGCGSKTHREDRVHYGESHECPLVLEPRVQIYTGTDEADEWRPETFDVHLRQHVEAAQPCVELGRGESPADFTLTIEEARALAGALLEVCEEVTPGT